MNSIKTFFIVCLGIFLSACAGSKSPSVDFTISSDTPLRVEASQTWEKFLDKNNSRILKRLSSDPYSLGGSIRFGFPDETHRVTYILWSNGDLPLRLDIQAGIGVNVAKIKETQKDLSIYITQQKEAIISNSTATISALVSLGMPIPLSFLDLSYLLRGQVNFPFESLPARNIKFDEKNSKFGSYTYHFEEVDSGKSLDGSNGAFYDASLDESNYEGDYVNEFSGESEENEFGDEIDLNEYVSDVFWGAITLNGAAQLIEYTIKDEWNIFIEYDEKNLPYKLKIVSLFNDYSMILLVKDRKNANMFQGDQLTFEFPKGTKIINNK